MDRFADMFARNAGRGEGAFMPFLVAGDPGPAQFLSVARHLIAAGAGGLELGMATLRPALDGGEITAAHQRALAGGATQSLCWVLIGRVRAEFPRLPICLQFYEADVPEPGPFCRSAAACGVDAMLGVGGEGGRGAEFRAAMLAAGSQPVMPVPGNCDDLGLLRAAHMSRGFVYVMSRPGPTGGERPMAPPDPRVIAGLRRFGGPPALVGFGVSTPAHVRAALDAGAAGVICGSAIAELIARHRQAPTKLETALRGFTAAMKTACRGRAAPARDLG